MLLRRVTEHVKDQNWFAVVLDFLIVVSGIWVALMVGQWSEARQQKAELKRAERDLNLEMTGVYYFAHERLAITPCRKARYRELGEMLLRTDQRWPGAPGTYGDGALTKHRVFPPVLRSPHRPWASVVWDTELSRGVLDVMPSAKRQMLSIYYDTVKTAASLQEEIYNTEARLQALSHPLEMTMSDRLSYYDVLAEADAQSALLELSAEQIIAGTEENNLLVFNDEDRLALQNFVAERNVSRSEVYGECAGEVVLPLLINEQPEGEGN